MTQATSYDELKDAISRAYPDLPRQLQRIARFSLERPTELALGTVAVVAESAQVQPSSLIRFANAFEFSGFTEMQQVFRSRLVERSGSYRTRIEQMRRQGKSADQGGVLHQLVGEAVAELGQLEEGVPVADVAAAVKLICAAGRVYVALTSLRNLGLRDVLIRNDDGYLLDPDAAIELIDERMVTG